MPKFNQNGGIDSDRDEWIKARNADLITLPQDVQGTNCGNCQYFRHMANMSGQCTHPKLGVLVNNRMCCSFWDNSGALRAWKQGNKP